MTELTTVDFKRLTLSFSDDEKPWNGIVWSNKGDRIGYNRFVTTEKGRFLQVFVLKKAK